MKKKTLVLVGIAVCAILLTSPVLASAGYSQIYGNANEDDVLDMRDVTYIKLAIFGKKPATGFADANYDDKISMLDVGQTKLIILGKEKKLTLIDQADRTVTIPRPVERAVTYSTDTTRVILALGASDKLVGIAHACFCSDCRYGSVSEEQFAEGGRLCELPDVDYQNIEQLAILKADLCFVFPSWTTRDWVTSIKEKTGTEVVGAAGGQTFEEIFEAYRIMGVIFDKEEEAEEIISFIEEKISKVTDVTAEIPDSEKPRVYIAARATSAGRGGFLRTESQYAPIDIAGGINVARDLEVRTPLISKEQIIAWNPDIILLSRKDLNEPTEAGVEEVLTDPTLQTVNAVRNKKVYYTTTYCRGTPAHRHLANVLYYAKLFYPEKFKDLDLEKEGNEIFERLIGVDGLYTWHADNTGYLREFIESQE